MHLCLDCWVAIAGDFLCYSDELYRFSRLVSCTCLGNRNTANVLIVVIFQLANYRVVVTEKVIQVISMTDQNDFGFCFKLLEKPHLVFYVLSGLFSTGAPSLCVKNLIEDI